MRPITNYIKKEQGFTFIEIIMVLVIIFVLGAYMVMRPAATSDISAAAAADQVESYIRYIQAKAMSTQAATSVSFASDAGGWYFTVGNQKYHVPQGISLAFSGSITFNSLGEPIPPIGTVTIGSTTITVVQTTGKVTRS